jgi:hypothetical protein
MVYYKAKLVDCEMTSLPNGNHYDWTESIASAESNIRLALTGSTHSGVSESILSKDTGIYGPGPNKDDIVRWCEKKGFEEVQWKRFLSSSKHKTFIVGPNTEKYQDSNWISVQKDMFGKRIVFWFTEKGDIKEIKKCESGKDGKDEPIDFDEAIKEIEAMS